MPSQPRRRQQRHRYSSVTMTNTSVTMVMKGRFFVDSVAGAFTPGADTKVTVFLARERTVRREITSSKCVFGVKRHFARNTLTESIIVPCGTTVSLVKTDSPITRVGNLTTVGEKRQRRPFPSNQMLTMTSMILYTPMILNFTHPPHLAQTLSLRML